MKWAILLWYLGAFTNLIRYMSTTMKAIIALLVIAAAGAALWWSGWLNSIGIMAPQQQSTATTTPQQTQQQQAVNDLPTPANDASDAAIQQDLAAFDVQMQATAGDVNQVDQGLNDKPVAQEY